MNLRPRMRLVDGPTEETAQFFERTLVSPVPAPNVLRLLANHPALLGRFVGLAGLLAAEGSIPGRELELVILRAAWRAGSEYEFAQHQGRAMDAGLSADQVAALCREDPGDWLEPDASLIALVDELHRHGEVSDTTFARLRLRYDERQLIELLLVPGFYRMLAGLLRTARVPVDDGLPGWPAGSETSSAPRS